MIDLLQHIIGQFKDKSSQANSRKCVLSAQNLHTSIICRVHRYCGHSWSLTISHGIHSKLVMHFPHVWSYPNFVSTEKQNPKAAQGRAR